MRLATLDEALEEVKGDRNYDADGAVAYLGKALTWASERIAAECARVHKIEFWPKVATVYYDARGAHIVDGSLLRLDRGSMLELTQVTLGDGTVLEPDTDYFPYPRDEIPIRRIRLVSGWSWYSYSDEWRDAIQIEGIIGQHSRYDEAWIGSGEVVPVGGIAIGADSFTADDFSGADAWFRTPRFSVGQLLRITTGDAYEFVEVMNVDQTDGTVSIRREVNGTEAIAHLAGGAIDIWQAEPNIVRATARYVSFLYKRRGHFETSTFDGAVSTRFPQTIPVEVQEIIDLYKPKKVRVS
jgi:hypothetical protein